MCGQGGVAVLVGLVDVLLCLEVHCLLFLVHLLVYASDTGVLNGKKVDRSRSVCVYVCECIVMYMCKVCTCMCVMCVQNMCVVCVL